MKRLLIVLMVLISLPIVGNAQKINWMTFKEALELNQTAPKKIFVDVYTGWCGWCIKMDRTTFQDSTVVAYMNENFYAVKLDAEMTDTIVIGRYTYTNSRGFDGKWGVHQLAMKLLQGQAAFPSFVLLDERNRIITIERSYKPAKDFLPMLMYYGSDAYLNQ